MAITTTCDICGKHIDKDVRELNVLIPILGLEYSTKYHDICLSCVKRLKQGIIKEFEKVRADIRREDEKEKGK